LISQAQNSGAAWSTTSFITKKERVCRTPDGALNRLPWRRLKPSTYADFRRLRIAY
jgi:hypothetical protein